MQLGQKLVLEQKLVLVLALVDVVHAAAAVLVVAVAELAVELCGQEEQLWVQEVVLLQMLGLGQEYWKAVEPALELSHEQIDL